MCGTLVQDTSPIADPESKLGRIRRTSFVWQTVFWIVLAAAVAATLNRAAQLGRGADFDFDSSRDYLVTRAVDGDTLLLSGDVRVRLLGIDTPESVHPSRPAEPLGTAASEFTAARANGTSVRLVFDRERQDRYGRVLAWVFVGDECLNESIVRQGFSKAVLRSPLRPDYRKRLIATEQLAREERLGIWATEPAP